PWAGSLSTAHTLLFYDRHGPDVFRRLAGRPRRAIPSPSWSGVARFDLAAITERSGAAEAEIWQKLVRERREVSRAAYRARADPLPLAKPAPQRYRYTMGAPPRPDGPRPRHAVNRATLRRPTW